ncbi:extracellular solute-binding protein [bacterium]|nr:extracellular solute-binding protein [bacterium]
MSRRLLFLSLALLAVLPTGCGSGKKKIRVFAADALAASFGEMKREFEKAHPDSEVILDIHGSILLTRIVPVRRADVVAVADHRLVEKILAPDHCRWVAKFASTELVLARTTSSKYQAEINSDNWFDILLRPDVSYGTADPALDPCGYYTHLVWKLAEKHYAASNGGRRLYGELVKGCAREHVSRDALSLISEVLSTNRVDYAFVYKVHARDLKLPYTPLPPEINLGRLDLEEQYATVEANVPNYRGGTETMTAAAIAFGLSIPSDSINPEGAAAFIRFVVSEKGRAILKRSDFVSISPPAVAKWGAAKVPPGLFGGEAAK